MDEYWGELKRCDDNEEGLGKFFTNKLTKSKYLFGRGQDCDFKFPNNKYLSTNHCYIEKDDEDHHKAWFVDQSTNGTIINLNKKIHKTRYELQNKDKIFIVHRKNDPKKNIGFQFEYKQRAQQFEATQAYDCTEFLNMKNEDETPNKAEGSIKRFLSDHEEESKEEIKEKKSKHDTSNIINEEIKEENIVTTPKKTNNIIKEQLVCTICDELMHDCVSLQPCLHSYCAGCYSDWMDKSDECPICRSIVRCISRNHLVNSLIESYLKENPHCKRNQDELDRLNEKNKINGDMVYPRKNPKINKYNDDYDSDDDIRKEKEKNKQDEEEAAKKEAESTTSDENSETEDEPDYENDEDEDYEPPAGLALPNAGRGAYNYFFAPPAVPLFQPPVPAPFRFVCRQCPQNKWMNVGMKGPDYTCNPAQNHLLCQCCLEAFPDRNNEMQFNPLLPKQNCSMCFKAFCDLYWGCRKGGCKNCLTKFINLTFDDNLNNNECLNSIINDNQFESQIFTDWMVRHNKTLKQIFNECIQKMMLGAYKAGNLNQNDILDKVVCRKCGLSLFQELAYQYRKDIPNNELFNNGNLRPNCYYGKNCRTQKHNAEHSKRYNHVCEQTKMN